MADMSDVFPPVQANKDMVWGTRRQTFKPELTAQEKADAAARQALMDQITSIYENACFSDGNQPNFYYREYEDVGLLAVFQAGLEAGRQEKTDD